mmetsp:Transcript_21630/g.70597  ORF Transcript_21630/g.70597 Transcript_21630/m.70597 type:complete len:729 (-) Transcript_21630:451-2637(-)
MIGGSGGSGGGEEQVRPEQLRSLIERENARLEAAGEYEAEPLRVRLSWRRAPTLVLIDTPGLIGPADGLELGEAAAAVEGLVLQHLTPPKRLILCLEDTSDWAISRTMAVVSRADTDLRRTLLVGTKLDAKMAQFSLPEDLRGLVDPPALAAERPHLLGGPIFTSVPPLRSDSRHAGRKAAAAGGGAGGYSDLIEEHEASLRRLLGSKLQSSEFDARIGVSALWRLMAPHLTARWLELVQETSRELEARIGKIRAELNAPPPPPPAQAVEDFADRFAACVNTLIKGTASISPSEHGETLSQEIVASASGALCRFTSVDGKGGAAAAAVAAARAAQGRAESSGDGADGESSEPGSVVPSDVEEELNLWLHSQKRLFGGAQYWRALQEFMLGAVEGPAEEVTTEEILNAMGFDGYHDGVNYMRAVSVIVVEKARGYFEQHLALLRLRLLHVMHRMTGQVDSMLSAEELPYVDPQDAADGLAETAGLGLSREQHRRMMGAVAPLYVGFVDKAMESCMRKCMYDVEAITKYVVWDSSSATKESLYNVFVQPVAAHLRSRRRDGAAGRKALVASGRQQQQQQQQGGGSGGAPAFESYEELVASFTEVLTSRRVTEQMRSLMSALVSEIISAWRQEFCRMISLKLNSFFLMPFCQNLPAYLRRSMLELGEAGGLGFEPGNQPREGRMEQLREELSRLTGEKAALQRISSRMQAVAFTGRSRPLPRPPLAKSAQG